MLYQNAATLTGLIVWYGVLVQLGAPGRGYWHWLWPLLPLAAGWCSFRAAGWYLVCMHSCLPLQQLPHGHTLRLFIQDVGLREELIKLLFALPCMLWLAPRTAAPQNPMLTAAFVGLGFATAENRWIFGGLAEPAVLVARVFSTTALHMTSTALCGAALMAACQRSRPWSWFWALILCMAAAHGLYDWAPSSTWIWLRAGGTSWPSQAVVIALMVGFFRTCLRLQPASPQSPHTALRWFIMGTAVQYTLVPVLAWLRWGTADALWVCARECLLFLPAAAAAALAAHGSSPHRHIS